MAFGVYRVSISNGRFFAGTQGEPVWPSGKALVRQVSGRRRFKSRPRFGSPFSLTGCVYGHCLNYEFAYHNV